MLLSNRKRKKILMLLRVTLIITGMTTLMSSLVTKLLLCSVLIASQPMVLYDHTRSIAVDLLKLRMLCLQTMCKRLYCVTISLSAGTVPIDNLQVSYLCKIAYK